MNIKQKRMFGIESLEKKFGPMSVGLFIKSFREADAISQTEYARRLGISRANLCDIEKGRKLVSPDRASKLADRLGVPEAVLIRLALQDSLCAAKLDYTVELKAS